MLAGIWNLDGRPLGRSTIDAVLAPLTPAPRGRGLWREGSAALAVIPSLATSAHDRPLVTSAGVVVVFDGRLHDRHHLVEELGNLPEADELMTDALLVSAAYERWDESFADHLRGEFAFAIFDPRRQWTLLGRDPSGARPLHYLRMPDTFVFASRVDALLRHPDARARPHEAHLARLVLGGPPQHDTITSTPFDGVHSVAPGNLAVLSRGRFATRATADPLLEPRSAQPVGGQEISAAIDRSVARRAGGFPVVVELGTWGAETLLGAALRSPGTTATALVPAGRSAPPAAAAGIAIPRPNAPMSASLEACVATSESPRPDPWWAPRMHALEQAADQGARVWLSTRGAESLFASDAHLADLVRHFHVREAFRETPGSVTERVRTLGRSAAEGLVPEALQQPARAVSAYVRGPLRDADWYSNSFRLWAMKASTRERPPQGLATHAARGVYEHARAAELVFEMERDAKTGAAAGLEVAFPFLDSEVVRALMDVPGAERSPGGDPSALLPVRPSPPPEDPSTDLLLADWEELRKRLLRVGAASGAGYVEHDMLEAELGFLRDDLTAGRPTATHRLSDLAGLELFLEGLARA